ncbi:GNAT family N-acetyltransferase [Maritalea porphyrae]|mgnify:CR=1 FL=1|jgi:ribosomal-protein-alanine N-acetyltransferase|uniref:GNAT family N-acetyltransferase n=1 Tax=Maritalea porphyrae TaxID=880732 RepID=UPI0022AF4B80|nr:GNAT family N-acetyltransferase [Maritalea porphyrae]MCZ4273242.1 GNAT family N-acetyltransferase [Maritalea porphyrae]
MENTQPSSPIKTYALETQRLVLRPFSTADTHRIVQIFADPRVSKWVDDGTPLSEDQAKRWIAASFASVEKNGTSAGAIIEKNTGQMIGWGGIVHPQGTSPEIIYGLEYAAWGNGYAKEIATAIVKNGLGILKINRLRATVDPENIASIKILRSLGFQLISSGLDENGLPTDVYHLG